MASNGSGGSGLLSLRSFNHISLFCEDVNKSAQFYKNFLGFDRVDGPVLDFHGVWLYNYGISILLLESKDPNNLPKKRDIDPKDNRIAFQCDDIEAAARKLKEKELKYYFQPLGEGNMRIERLFFHDPQHYMIELCTCEAPAPAPALALARARARAPAPAKAKAAKAKAVKAEAEGGDGDGDKAVKAETDGVKTEAEGGDGDGDKAVKVETDGVKTEAEGGDGDGDEDKAVKAETDGVKTEAEGGDGDGDGDKAEIDGVKTKAEGGDGDKAETDVVKTKADS